MSLCVGTPTAGKWHGPQEASQFSIVLQKLVHLVWLGFKLGGDQAECLTIFEHESVWLFVVFPLSQHRQQSPKNNYSEYWLTKCLVQRKQLINKNVQVLESLCCSSGLTTPVCNGHSTRIFGIIYHSWSLVYINIEGRRQHKTLIWFVVYPINRSSK